MFPEPPSVTQLSQVIAQVTARHSFLVRFAAFISGLTIRLNRIVDRLQALNEIRDVKGRLKSDIPRLEHRAHLLNRAMLSSTISAIIASSLVIVSFVSAYLNVRHEYGVSSLFILSVACLILSLISAAPETRIALTAARIS